MRTVHFLLCFLAGAVLTSRPAAAGIVVDPGGAIRDLAGDPVRPVFYATLDTGELVTIDIASASVSGRFLLPGDPGAIAVTPDGQHLWVVLRDSFDLAVVDLPAVTVSGVALLSATEPPSDVVAGTSRVYAVTDDGLSIVDAATRLEAWVPNRSDFYNSELELSPDERILYAIDRGLSPTSLYAYEVCDDALHQVGEDICHGCLGSNGQQVAMAPDASFLVVSSGSPYYFQLLETEGALAPLGSIPTGAYPTEIALARDGSRVYLAHQVDDDILIADPHSRLVFHSEPLRGDPDLLALSSDDGTLAVAIETTTSSGPDRVELIDVRSPLPNRGGLRLRPIDSVTGEAIVDAVIRDPVFEGASAWLDPTGGLLGRAPIAPGNYPVDVTATGYSTVTLLVTIAAGAWTDLGDVPFTRTGTPSAPDDLGVVPSLDPGTTRAVTLLGRGFTPGAAVTSSVPELIVNRAEFRDPGRIDLVLTTTAAATPGLKNNALRVQLLDSRAASGDVWIRDGVCPFTLRPPNPIPVLYAVKTRPFDVTLVWDDSLVDPRHDAADEYLPFRSTTVPDAGYLPLPPLVSAPALRESLLDAGAIASNAPFSSLHFYRISAQNSAGDSGDLP